MKILQLISNLFTKKKKEMTPKESIIFNGIPERLELNKKNLIISDVLDVAVLSNDNIVTCGVVAINQFEKTTDGNIRMEFLSLTAPIPKDSELRLELNGIVYDPNTNKIEYKIYPSIKDVKRVDDNQVSFKIDNITTAVVSTEMVPVI